jgi:hypothetical protein
MLLPLVIRTQKLPLILERYIPIIASVLYIIRVCKKLCELFLLLLNFCLYLFLSQCSILLLCIIVVVLIVFEVIYVIVISVLLYRLHDFLLDLVQLRLDLI